MAIVKQPKCIASGCKSVVKWRGLCTACYFEARRRIKDGTTTEESLIKRKMMLPAKPGRRNRNALAKMISK